MVHNSRIFAFLSIFFKSCFNPNHFINHIRFKGNILLNCSSSEAKSRIFRISKECPWLFYLCFKKTFQTEFYILIIYSFIKKNGVIPAYKIQISVGLNPTAIMIKMGSMERDRVFKEEFIPNQGHLWHETHNMHALRSINYF